MPTHKEQLPAAENRPVHDALVSHLRGAALQKTHGVLSGYRVDLPAAKELTEWAGACLEACRDAGFGSNEYEREKIPRFLEALQGGFSWADAAAAADFRSRDPATCSSGKKARIVLTSVLGHQPGGQNLLRALETLHPESVPSPLVIHPLWEEDCERRGDFAGRVRRMETAVPDLISIVRENDQQSVSAAVRASVPDAQLHQQALEKVTQVLLRGDLNIFRYSEAQRGGLKVEPRSVDGKYLLCLHTHAETRIYGVYDKTTGTITWRGIVESHRRWSQFIKQFTP